MNPAPSQPRPNAANRSSVVPKLIFAGAFLLLLLGVCAWVVHTYIFQGVQVIRLPQDIAKVADAPVGAAARAMRQASANPSPANRPPPINSPSFTGKVIDAQTHDPIKDFTIRVGYSFNGNNQSPRYDNQPSQEFKSDTGSYRFTSRMGGPTIWYVRVEAHGYLPAVSAELKRTGGAADFELTPSKDLAGHVFAPDGSPAAGVELAVVLGGQYFGINNGKFQQRQGVDKPFTTGPDGAYDLPPQIDKYMIVAVSELGSAQADQVALANSPDLHLTAWGGLDGVLRIGSKPAANMVVSAATLEMNPTNDQTSPRISWNQTANTDADGHFSMNRVRPGQVQLGRQITQHFGANGITMTNLSQSGQAVVTPGQTTVADVGGGGRTVTGKFILPNGVSASQFYISSNVNGQPSGPILPQMPDSVKNGATGGRQMWIQLFSITPAGRDYLKSHPQPANVPQAYAIEFLPKNTFQIQDVQPGDYTAWLYLQVMNGNRPGQQTQFNFTVPPITPELIDQPLEVPDVKLN